MALFSHLPAGSGSFYPYSIDQSCRFNDDDSAYLSRTTGGAATEGKAFSFSTWIKPCVVGAGEKMIISSGPDINNRAVIEYFPNNQLVWY